MIKAEYVGPPMLSKQALERTEKRLRQQISDRGANFTMRSQTGTTLAIAVNIHEELRLPYTVFAIPGVGYGLKGGEPA